MNDSINNDHFKEYTGTPYIYQSYTMPYPCIQNEEKPFKLGLMLGRFQHVHIGHEHVINQALKVCDKVLILIGSAQESGTLRNPFPIHSRIDLMSAIYGNNPNVVISSIDDMTNEDDHCHEWGKFVLKKAAEVCQLKKLGCNPDVLIYGNDEERKGWFHPDDVQYISQFIVSRNDITISATQVRQFLVDGDLWKWRQYTNPLIHDYYNSLCKLLKNNQFYNKEKTK